MVFSSWVCHWIIKIADWLNLGYGGAYNSTLPQSPITQKWLKGCIKCSTNLMWMNKFEDEEECLQYLIDHNLIIVKKCDGCRNIWGEGHFGAADSVPPIQRRRFGAGQFDAVPFRRRTFQRHFLFYFIFRVMKKIQWSRQFLECRWARTCWN